jgi:hypothetical protein
MKRACSLLAILLTLTLVTVQCSKEGPMGPKGDKGDIGDIGPQGPTGIQGPTGAEGPKGDKGDSDSTAAHRYVYYSLTVVPTNGSHCYSMPIVTGDPTKMVSLTVYARLEGTSLWFEVPLYFEGDANAGKFYYFYEGNVCVDQLANCWLAFVIIK